jgi:hypothetical protein
MQIGSTFLDACADRFQRGLSPGLTYSTSPLPLPMPYLLNGHLDADLEKHSHSFGEPAIKTGERSLPTASSFSGT